MFWALIRARKSLCVLTWGMLFTLEAPVAYTENGGECGRNNLSLSAHPAPYMNALYNPQISKRRRSTSFTLPNQEFIAALMVHLGREKRRKTWLVISCAMPSIKRGRPRLNTHHHLLSFEVRLKPDCCDPGAINPERTVTELPIELPLSTEM